MLFFVTLTVLLVSVQAKFWTDCGSNAARVDSVRVSGCSERASKCVIRKNNEVILNIDFTPITNIESLKAIVNGMLFDTELQIDVAQANACRDHNLSCPLPANQRASYQYRYWVDKNQFPLDGKLKWELKTDEGERVVCVLMNGKISFF